MITALFNLVGVLPSDCQSHPRAEKSFSGRCDVLVAAFFSLVAVSSTHGQTLWARSTFDTDVEGWSIRTNNSGNGCTLTSLNVLTPVWVATGGNPDGFIQHVDPRESRTAFWRSPASFHGNLESVYGGVLKFDLRQSATDNQYNEFDVLVQGNGITLMYDTPYNPRTTWTNYEVPIRAGAGWRVGTCDGPFATETQIRTVLGATTIWLIRGEFRGGADTDGLDNVELWGPPPIQPALASTFESDADGWWVTGDATPSWDATGGNPGGCLRGDDAVQGVGYSFVAPSKFLGDRSSLIGSTLLLDLRASPGSDFLPGLGFVFLSNGVTEINYVSPTPLAGNVWRTHALPLTPCPAWVRTSDGLPATESDFAAVLGNLSRFLIRGEYREGSETERIDDVILGDCAPSAFAWTQNRYVCPQSGVEIRVAAGGEANRTYRWRRNGADLFNGGPISGADTPVLVLASLDPNWVGPFDCIVTNSCGSWTSNSVFVSICEADYNCDVVVDLFDYLDFVAAFSGQDPNADFNRDGVVDFFDYLDFVAAFSAGC